MEALTASTAKLFNKHPASFWYQTPTRDAAANNLSRPEIRFLGYLKKRVNLGFSSSLYRKTIQPISSGTALSETQTSVANEEIQTNDTTQFKTVHVKFQLQRECSFGQQFLMVGDDPVLGVWDPSSAIPLNWSEGHVWTVEMDIPCDKVMKYKFILKGGDDTISWQPGPDRILETWDTRKTINVCEDWDNAELQTIIEEDSIIHPLLESMDNLEVKKVTESTLLQPNGDSESFVKEELTKTNGYSQPTKKPLAQEPMAIVAENITEQNGERAVKVNGFPGAKFDTNANKFVTLEIKDYQNSGRSSSSENLIPSEDEKNLDSGVAIPVLVPGLPPFPTAETEEAPVSKADKHISTESSLYYNAQELNVPELNLKEEPGIDFSIPKEETQTLLNDKLELHDKGHDVQNTQSFEEKDQPNNTGVDHDVLENDVKWGRRTLQQFLKNLGLL